MLRIKLVPAARKIAQFQFDPLRKYVRELENVGYTFVENNPDLIFIQKFNSTPPILKQLTKIAPVVIFGDEASTGTSAFQFLHIPGVIGYVKKQLLRDKNLYKWKYPRKRYHYYMIGQLNDTMKSFKRLDRSINDDILKRVHLGWSFAVSDRRGIEASNRPSFKNRSIDIHMSMTTKTKFKYEPIIAGLFDNHYAFHRGSWEYEVNRIAKKYNLIQSGRCKKELYYSKLLLSKICIVPHGLGEVTFRDFEAISHGALMLHADMSHLEVWPDIYQPNQTYIPIKLDGSDLEEKILDIVHNYGKYIPIAKNAYDVLRNHRDGIVFANKFDQIMKAVLINGGTDVSNSRT